MVRKILFGVELVDNTVDGVVGVAVVWVELNATLRHYYIDVLPLVATVVLRDAEVVGNALVGQYARYEYGETVAVDATLAVSPRTVRTAKLFTACVVILVLYVTEQELPYIMTEFFEVGIPEVVGNLACLPVALRNPFRQQLRYIVLG